MAICAVIPSYNVSATIQGIAGEIKRQGIDVIVVDDGSSDPTSDKAAKAGAEVLRNKINLGKGSSLRKGFALALSRGYDAVITLDGDGQHLPEDIAVFLKTHRVYPEAAMIVGNRMACPTGMPFARRLTNRAMSGLISFICGQGIPDTQNGFRLIKCSLLKNIELRSDRFEVESELTIKCAQGGGKIISIPVSSVYKNKSSQINPLTDTARFIRFILPHLFIHPRLKAGK